MFMFKQVNITITTEIIRKGSEVVSSLHDTCLSGPQSSVSILCEKGFLVILPETQDTHLSNDSSFDFKIPSRLKSFNAFLANMCKTTVPKIGRVQVMLGSMLIQL